MPLSFQYRLHRARARAPAAQRAPGGGRRVRRRRTASRRTVVGRPAGGVSVPRGRSARRRTGPIRQGADTPRRPGGPAHTHPHVGL